MPLRVIRDLLERGEAEPERLRAMIELEDRILDRALAGERERVPAAEVEARYEVPGEVLERLAEVGVLSPDADGYSPSDVRIIEAIGRFRAGRLRREPRLHRLRHAALQARARAAGRGGGQGADRAARRGPRPGPGDGDRRGRDRARSTT